MKLFFVILNILFCTSLSFTQQSSNSKSLEELKMELLKLKQQVDENNKKTVPTPSNMKDGSLKLKASEPFNTVPVNKSPNISNVGSFNSVNEDIKVVSFNKSNLGVFKETGGFEPLPVRIKPDLSAAVNCDRCNGNKTIVVAKPCQYCYATGQTKCYAYGCSAGKAECSNCRGRGKLTCSKCNGTGQSFAMQLTTGILGAISDGFGVQSTNSTPVNTKCGKCNGKGTLGCNYCDGSGIQDCNNCSGRGEISCSYCNASGQITTTVTCPKCTGLGYFVRK